MKKVFIIDSPLYVLGYQRFLQELGGFELCGWAHDVKSIPELIEKHKPEIVLFDIGYLKLDGLALIKKYRSSIPQIDFLVSSFWEEELYAIRSLKSGALGYIMKGEPLELLKKAFKVIASGNIYVSEKTSAKLMHKLLTKSQPHTLDSLSDRQLEVFKRMGQGCSTKETALALGMSPKTVESHRSQIRKKLNLSGENGLKMAAMNKFGI